MKNSTCNTEFPVNQTVIETVFHELKSSLSGILSSVELIELYSTVSKAPERRSAVKVMRQAATIKSQVLELDYQLQNAWLMQHALNHSLVTGKEMINPVFFIAHMTQEEPYAALLSNISTCHVYRQPPEMCTDPALLQQLILNIYFHITRRVNNNHAPTLRFEFGKEGLLIYAQYVSSRQQQESSLLLISYLAAVLGGHCKVDTKTGGQQVLHITIPYGDNL